MIGSAIVSPATVPFKRLAEPTLGKMLQNVPSGKLDELVPFLKAGHVQWGRIDVPDELPEMWASPSDLQSLRVQDGDLLICEGGEVGRAAIVGNGIPANTIIQNSLHLVRPGPAASVRFLKYALEHIAGSGWLDIWVCLPIPDTDLS